MTTSTIQGALTWNNGGPTNEWITAAGNGNWLPGNVLWVNGEDAIFGTTPEAVSVTTANTVDDITFQGNWTIGNGAGSLALADTNSNITVDPTFVAIVQETVAGSGSGLTKLGTGTLVFQGNLSYTGPTIIDAGILQLNSSVASTTTYTVNTSGTLRYASSTNWTASNNATTLDGGTLSYVGSDLFGRYTVLPSTVSVTSASAITVSTGAGAGVGSNASGLFLDGALTGSAPLNITVSTNGKGVVLRSGSSNYNGTITVNGTASATAGTGSGLTIGVGANSSLASADIVIDGMFDLGNAGGHMTWGNGAVSGTTFLMDALGGTGVVVANMTAGGSTRTLSIGNNHGSGAFSGRITNGVNNTFSLIKLGQGTQVLSGMNNDYTGATNVNAGELIVTGAITSSQVNVANGAAIGGSGTIGNNLGLGLGNLVFDLAYVDANALTINGTFSWASSFGVDNLVAADGSAVDWSSVADGAYTLLETSASFNAGNIENFGFANAYSLGGGRLAYFSQGSLVLNIETIPEPAGVALAVAGGMAVLLMLRFQASGRNRRMNES